MSPVPPVPAPLASISVPESTPWSHLRRYTPARIALGRTGGSLPTRALLEFNLDQALASDAVHAPFHADALATQLRALPAVPEVHVLNTAAHSRAVYLQRPDLGRKLDPADATYLSTLATAGHGETSAPIVSPATLAIIASDGLSALAAERQVVPLLGELLPRLHAAGFLLKPICVVRFARVGVIDEIGSLLGATTAMILLGERPGLGAPDSLGAYFTFAPGPGKTDADRNCVSNIRPAGLPIPAAAEKLAAWLLQALDRRTSGVLLKEPSSPGVLGTAQVHASRAGLRPGLGST